MDFENLIPMNAWKKSRHWPTYLNLQNISNDPPNYRNISNDEPNYQKICNDASKATSHSENERALIALMFPIQSSLRCYAPEMTKVSSQLLLFFSPKMAFSIVYKIATDPKYYLGEYWRNNNACMLDAAVIYGMAGHYCTGDLRWLLAGLGIGVMPTTYQFDLFDGFMKNGYRFVFKYALGLLCNVPQSLHTILVGERFIFKKAMQYAVAFDDHELDQIGLKREVAFGKMTFKAEISKEISLALHQMTLDHHDPQHDEQKSSAMEMVPSIHTPPNAHRQVLSDNLVVSWPSSNTQIETPANTNPIMMMTMAMCKCGDKSFTTQITDVSALKRTALQEFNIIGLEQEFELVFRGMQCSDVIEFELYFVHGFTKLNMIYFDGNGMRNVEETRYVCGGVGGAEKQAMIPAGTIVFDHSSKRLLRSWSATKDLSKEVDAVGVPQKIYDALYKDRNLWCVIVVANGKARFETLGNYHIKKLDTSKKRLGVVKDLWKKKGSSEALTNINSTNLTLLKPNLKEFCILFDM
eukprot:27951_1